LKKLLKSRERKRNHKHCRFCDWIEGGNKWKLSVEGTARIVDENKNWIACLDKFPKVVGHTLIISKKPYNDIADISELTNEEAYDFFKIMRRVTIKLKKKFNVNKVYVMSICEHYEVDEIVYTDKKTSEHLHFHLLPYNKSNNLMISPETVFTFEEKEMTFNQMKTVKDRICK